MTNKYITTTIPYVNADPHIGFALEIVQADTWARAQNLIGNSVVFNTGTDEHGAKIYEKAQIENKDTQDYVNEYAVKFGNLKPALNLSYTNFIRTTNDDHIKAAQEFWNRCAQNGDIYIDTYKVKYCVGCELAKTESELVDGKCPLHSNREVELIEEENYFFRFSKYQKKLLELYSKQPDFVKPAHRLEEIKNFVSNGLEDFSISRIKEKMPWGIAVPGDDHHVMYVWFDALVNYISTLGWPTDMTSFSKSWPGVQVAGKDNLRQQSAMWQAMLMSAGIESSSKIFIHGFITMNGQKISKSLGNVVDPFKLVEKYGTDTVRYYLLREIPALDDGDFSFSRMDQIFESDLANELGNLVSRVTTLAQKDGVEMSEQPLEKTSISNEHLKMIESFEFAKVLESIWQNFKLMNKEINEVEPWKLQLDQRTPYLIKWLSLLSNQGYALKPFLPDTAEKIINATTGKIEKIAPLFPKKNLNHNS